VRTFALAIPLLAAAAPAVGVPFETHRVAERVVVVRCGSNNVGAVASAAGVIVVDTHRSPTLMRGLARAMAAELGRDDFRFVVNTHGHWDHSSGNQVFPEATVIGHVRCREHVAASRLDSPRSRWGHERRLARLAEPLDAGPGDSTEAARLRVEREIEQTVVEDLAGAYVATPPTETFEDRREIDGGDLTVELLHCGEAHTDHDVFAWIPAERVLFTGDVFCSANGFCYAIHALVEVPRLVAVLDEVLAAGSEEIVVVPGHGDFLGREDLRRLREIARERFAAVRPDDSAARFLADRAERVGWEAAREALEAAREGPQRWYVADEEIAVLAERWAGRGRVDETRSLLEWAVGRSPESPLLWQLLGEACRRGGDVAAARRACGKALELEPRLRSAAEELEWLSIPSGSAAP
jgi:cyclase